ncbi:MAG: hypothetical protein ACKPKO_38650, partial [Candidatus Fonsibacter sp.]
MVSSQPAPDLTLTERGEVRLVPRVRLQERQEEAFARVLASRDVFIQTVGCTGDIHKCRAILFSA